jgi:signal transduction histidine kinase
MARKSTQQPDVLAGLLRAAMGRNARDCISDMLEVTIKAMNASGAVLWQATEDARPQESPPVGYMFMLATAFPELGSFGIHDLDFVDTIAGLAVRHKKPDIVNDIRTHGRKYREHPFLVRHRLNKTIALPFVFKGSTPGAVTVYRREDAADFTQADVATLKRIFRHIPELLVASQTRARQDLLEKAGEIFKQLDAGTKAGISTKAAWEQGIRKLGEEISELFHTAETSIILRASESSERYVIATTKTKPIHRKRLREDGWTHNKQTSSFTEAALTLGKSLRIPDLRQPHEAVRLLRENGLPDFEWKSSATLEQHAWEVLGGVPADPEEKLPPLSFLVVPVKSGARIHGILRCWIAKPPISYFSLQDQNLLELVADQLGRQCELRRREASIATENAAWRKIASVFHEKRDYRSPLSKPMGRGEDSDDFSVGCINLLGEVAAEADVNALWLVNKSGKSLSCAVAPWIHASPDASQDAISKWSEYVSLEIPLAGDSPLARALSSGVEIPLIGRRLAALDASLPGQQKLVAIPIRTQNESLGVLELGSSSPKPFQEYTLHSARLIAAFLSQHLATRTAISGHQAAEKARIDMERFTNDAFRDIMHQMKGPLLEAVRRIEEFKNVFFPESPQWMAADKAAVLVKRSARMSRLVGIFGQLARNNRIVAGDQLSEAAEILEVIDEALESARFRAKPRMRLHFNADLTSLRKALPRKSLLNLELLLHAILNILDNAVKYSYRNKEIRVDGGLASTGGWFIRVWNQGIPLHPNEVRLAKQREWRSTMARLTTGEGTGIGLWIVDAIMQALGGTLELQPTRADGWTIVRLQFNPVPLPPQDAKNSLI